MTRGQRRLAWMLATWSRLSPLERFAAVTLLAVLLLAVLGPTLAPYPTETAEPADRLMAPSWAHPLGTDENGMDILSRIMAAPRADVVIAVLATGLSLAIGVPIGMLAGLAEGGDRRLSAFVSELTLRVLDAVQAFPVFVFAMVLVAVRGASTANIVAAVAFVNAPVFIRLTRSEVLHLRERPFAEAARAVGNGPVAVGFRHLLPNALPPIIAQMSVTVGFAILLTAGLSFVGAGVSPPTPELGSMISTGAKFMVTGQWWPSLFPGIALGLLVFTFAAVGELLGRLLDPGEDIGFSTDRVPDATVDDALLEGAR